MIGAQNHIQVPTPRTSFRITEHDRVTINGTDFDFAGKSGDGYYLKPSEGNGLVQWFDAAQLSRLSAAGRINHSVGYYLPHDQKAAASSTISFRVSDLDAKQAERFHMKHAFMCAIDDIKAEHPDFKPSTKMIEEYLPEISAKATVYLKVVATEADLLEDQRLQGSMPVKGAGLPRRKRGGREVTTALPFQPDTLRKMYRTFKHDGPAGLVDNLSKSGNYTSLYGPEERALLASSARKSHLTLERKTITATVKDVKLAFKAVNQTRRENGLIELQTPGKDAIGRYLKNIPELEATIARRGRAYALKHLRPVIGGVEVARPGQRVEIDEQRIDLMTVLASPELQAYFGDEFLAPILSEEKRRWWIVLAIDCRTKIVLGMKLTLDPQSSAAKQCLQMVVRDKGLWSSDAGGRSSWDHAVVPEELVSDNGSGFKARDFTEACLDLGVAHVRTAAKSPTMRGVIERMFNTLSGSLMPRLSGRTFANPHTRGDYDADARACLNADDLAWVLVRWVVDIYHNTPHSGLLGLTPLEKWEEDIAAGNYPLRALPDRHHQRLAFGARLQRTLSKEGITVMGIRYNSPELAGLLARSGRQKMDIRWDQSDLSAIAVRLDGAWKNVPAVSPAQSEFDLHVWLKARRDLRAKYAKRRELSESIVLDAIKEIEKLNATRTAAFGLIDRTLSVDQLEKIEREMFSGFAITADQPIADDAGYGTLIEPRKPVGTGSNSARFAMSHGVEGDAAELSTRATSSPARWSLPTPLGE